MSVPAPSLPARGVPARRTAPAPNASPGATGAVPAVRTVTRARRSRRFHPAFWVFSAVIITSIVVVLVSVSALVVETGFGIDRTEARIAQLIDDGERLRRDVASMSAPSRVAAWAKRRGLVMPEDVIVLPVRDVATDDEAAG